MVSSVDGLAGAAALVRQVPPQRREVASEARTGLTIPQTVLRLADEVIE